MQCLFYDIIFFKKYWCEKMNIEKIINSRMETLFISSVGSFVLGQICLSCGSSYNPNDFLGPLMENLMNLFHSGFNCLAGMFFCGGIVKFIFDRWL